MTDFHRKVAAATLGPGRSYAAFDRRIFRRFQIRVMTHRHDAERERIEDEKSRKPTILETSISIAVIAHPKLSREIKDRILRKPWNAPAARKMKR